MQSSDFRYLAKLKFNSKLRESWLNFFVTNFRVVILLIILISGAGIYAFLTLPRESNPEVKIPIVSIATVYPGASPSDIEELITKKIESKIASIKGIEDINSNSSNSLSVIVVKFDSREDTEKSLRSVRDKINEVKNQLPEDANDPQVEGASLDDSPIWTVAITGPYDEFTLRSYAEDLKKELEKSPGVKEIQISGGDQLEYEVAFDFNKITFYQISFEQIRQALQATNLTVPLGNFETNKYIYPIKVEARFFELEELMNIPILHNEKGAIVYLKDIASVKEKAVKKETYSKISSNGSVPEKSVSLFLIKRTGSSVIKTVEEANQKINSLLPTFAPEIKYEVILDQSKAIQDNFDQLSHDFLLTLGLVFGILFLIIGLKEAFVAGLAIPLVFFVAFVVMKFTGISLNFLSIFALLLSLGLLVDDAIVVVSATKQYLQTGKWTPEEAVLLVLNDFKVVLTSTTLATVWAFFPMLFSSGIMGEFIKSIPITISVTLISSLVIALLINHPLAAVLERIRLVKKFFFLLLFFLFSLGFLLPIVNFFTIKRISLNFLSILAFVIFGLLLKWYLKNGNEQIKENGIMMKKEWKDDELVKKKLKAQGNRKESGFLNRLIHGIIHFDRFIPIYERSLRFILLNRKRRIITLFLVIVLFLGSVVLPITGIVEREFFPSSDESIITIDIRIPAGSKLEETEKVISQIETALLDYTEVKNFSTLIGRNSILSNNPETATNVASILINLTDEKEREKKSYELAKDLRERFISLEGALSVEVSALGGGPPTGAAFEAKVKGENLEKLEEKTNQLKDLLETIPGVINANISLKEAPADYTFFLNYEKLELYNLKAAYVGSVLRMAISGIEATSIIKEDKEIKVIFRFAQEQIPSLEAIQNLQIGNLQGNPVFIKDVATVKLMPGVNSITRNNQERSITLSAGIDPTISNSNKVQLAFQEKIKNGFELPQDYSIVYGGENKENEDSVKSIILAMLVAFALIFSTLVIQFNSFKKALIVLATLPLALIGVFIGLALTGISLSFPGLIGVLALFGIVVKNAIILVDKINLNVKSGIAFHESIIDAGKSRLEAIFITSICTIFGIIPVTLSNEIWTALGGTIIFGLSLSSFLTLFIIPLLFKIFVQED